MLSIQLDFFKTQEECEIDSLRKTVLEVKVSSDKVRRGTYARINEMSKECSDLKARLEILERYICNTTERTTYTHES